MRVPLQFCAAGLALTLAGCVTSHPQTAQEFREAVPGAFMAEVESFRSRPLVRGSYAGIPGQGAGLPERSRQNDLADQHELPGHRDRLHTDRARK